MPMSISSAVEASEQDVLFVNDAFCELTGYPSHWKAVKTQRCIGTYLGSAVLHT